MRTLHALLIGLVVASTSTRIATAQSGGASSCADSVPAAGNYGRCALWIDWRGVRQGTAGELIAKPRFLRPIALTRVVVGDSAKAYARKFERRSNQVALLSLAAVALTTAGFVVVHNQTCSAPLYGGGCAIVDNSGLVAAGLVLAGAVTLVATIPVDISARRSLAKSILWSNARFAR